jgi:hypothetical protein
MDSHYTSRIERGGEGNALVHVRRVSNRRFRASVKFRGGWVSGDGGSRISAIRRMERGLLESGVIRLPNWVVYEWYCKEGQVSPPYMSAVA